MNKILFSFTISMFPIFSYAEDIKLLSENKKSNEVSNFVQYLEKAAKETQKEAENGNAEAQYALGNIYSSGLGVQQNDLKVVEKICFTR